MKKAPKKPAKCKPTFGIKLQDEAELRVMAKCVGKKMDWVLREAIIAWKEEVCWMLGLDRWFKFSTLTDAQIKAINCRFQALLFTSFPSDTVHSATSRAKVLPYVRRPDPEAEVSRISLD